MLYSHNLPSILYFIVDPAPSQICPQNVERLHDDVSDITIPGGEVTIGRADGTRPGPPGIPTSLPGHDIQLVATAPGYVPASESQTSSVDLVPVHSFAGHIQQSPFNPSV